MTNVERVVKAIEEKEFTITHYPCRAYIEIYESDYKGFYGSVVEFEKVTPRTSSKYTLFISDKEDHEYFHKWLSVMGDRSMPEVLWFKEMNDRVIRYEGLYI